MTHGHVMCIFVCKISYISIDAFLWCVVVILIVLFVFLSVSIISVRCLVSCLYAVRFFDGFFFFKQKTAYELRISDWSSDVCSSDLMGVVGATGDHTQVLAPTSNQPAVQPAVASHRQDDEQPNRTWLWVLIGVLLIALIGAAAWFIPRMGDDPPPQVAVPRVIGETERSEEHTSELQSLMRISYAVFCLKKKITKSSYKL